jgi:hypothetical protein
MRRMRNFESRRCDMNHVRPSFIYDYRFGDSRDMLYASAGVHVGVSSAVSSSLAVHRDTKIQTLESTSPPALLQISSSCPLVLLRAAQFSRRNIRAHGRFKETLVRACKSCDLQTGGLANTSPKASLTRPRAINEIEFSQIWRGASCFKWFRL